MFMTNVNKNLFEDIIYKRDFKRKRQLDIFEFVMNGFWKITNVHSHLCDLSIENLFDILRELNDSGYKSCPLKVFPIDTV